MPIRCVAVGFFLLLPMISRAGERIEYDSPMFSDPVIDREPLKQIFDPRLVSLWSQALGQGEFELQRLAAESIARAHREGMQGLESTIPLLRGKLAADVRDPAVRLAVARALVELSDEDSYADILRRCQTDGLEMALTIEPQLGKRGYPAMKGYWLKRLSQPRESSVRVSLAIAGLVEMQTKEAGPLLLKIVVDRKMNGGLRLAAARAMEQLGASTAGLELAGWAEPSQPFLDRLIAATLTPLQGQNLGLLRKLAVDTNSAVARTALARLEAKDPKLIYPLADELLRSKSANVRMFAATGLASQPVEENVRQLAAQFDDRHPNVRNHARTLLFRLAQQPGKKELVIKSVVPRLSGTLVQRTAQGNRLDRRDWRPIQQAILLMAQLDVKSQAAPITKFLEHHKAEVYIAASWALRKLQVPATFPQMVRRVERIRDQQVLGNHNRQTDQVCQIFQAFGLGNYRPSEPLLVQFVRNKNDFDARARAAAVWALARIGAQTGSTDEKLRIATRLIDRLNDVASIPAEDEIVKQFSAQGLARLGFAKAASTIRRMHGKTNRDSLLRDSYRWSYKKLTGRPIGPREPRTKVVSGWFLEPVR